MKRWVFGFGFLLLYYAPIFAGWDSGGGESFRRDAHNPWFLENTPKVSYCVNIKEDDFGVDKSQAVKMIQKALTYWKTSFKDPFNESNTFHIGSQKFLLSEDCESADVVFQLGYLEDGQKKYLPAPEQFIGQTVRVSYNADIMRAKGFIYIAPESGPLRPRQAQYPENFWKFGDSILLYQVLVHELGHIFGLSHTGMTTILSSEHVMAVNYPDIILQNSKLVLSMPSLDPYFGLAHAGVVADRCFAGRDVALSLFQIPVGYNCVKVVYQSNSYGFDVYTAKNRGEPFEPIGKIRINGMTSGSFDGLIYIYFSGENQLKGGIGDNFMEINGTYYSHDGAIIRPIIGVLSRRAQVQHISGVINGMLVGFINGIDHKHKEVSL